MISSAKTSSIILYKFRTSRDFESVELPGASARLFDIKRAIVKAKKLDRGAGGSAAPQLEFELSVKNALTEEEYTDESMLLPRGTRLVIGRLPAAKGYGLLAKIARAEAGMSTTASNLITNRSAFTAPTGYFTIQSRAGEEDEFVDSAASPVDPLPQAATGTLNDQELEEKELAALKAVTDQAASMYRPHTTLNRSAISNKFGSAAPVVAGAPRPILNAPPQPFNAPHKMPPSMMKFSTDPELKEHELKQMQTKKRATGIPRTFLTMSGAEGNTSGNTDHGHDGEKEMSTIRLQPNTIGFEALIQRGGGQSESGGAQARSLEYAIKLTATTIPEHLQCGICHGVLKNAMLVPWDTEGRAVCELCMRDNLAKNGFKCPLTGMDGVSPDDLHPNYGLRKAADLFVQGVMELMDQIVMKQQADEEEEQKRERDSLMLAPKDAAKTIDDSDMGDSGFARKDRAMLQTKRKRQDQLDLDADFGGDVFDVAKADSPMDDDMQSLKRVEPTSDLNLAMDNDKKINGDDLFSENVESSDKNKSLANDNDDTDPQNFAPMESAVLGYEKGFNMESQKELNMEENLIANNHSSLDTEVDPTPNSKDETSFNRDGDNIDASLPIDGSEMTDHSSNNNKNGSANVTVIDRRELVKSRGPPPGYRIGPAGGVGIHGGFPSSPPIMMHPAGSFQPSPSSANFYSHNPARGDGNHLHGREGFRGRGHRGRGRDFRGGYPHSSYPSTPQVCCFTL